MSEQPNYPFRQAKSIAYQLHKQYPMVEREDIYQEIALFCVGAEIFTPTDDMEEDKRNDISQDNQRRMRKAGDRFCRYEKAASAGYDTEDEAFYSLARLKDLLEIFYADGITEHPPIAREDSVRHQSGDGSEAGTWMSSLIDVERGLSMISDEMAHRLKHRYGTKNVHLNDSDYGSAQGLTGDQVRGRTKSALLALQRSVGGGNPWNRGPTPHRGEVAA